MSVETRQFVEMVREAASKAVCVMPLYCEQCGTQRGMILQEETRTSEVYRCPVCGWTRWFRVR